MGDINCGRRVSIALHGRYKLWTILMAEAFAKIKPTDPLILARHEARRKRKWPEESGMSLVTKPMIHGENAGINFEKTKEVITNVA
jgi:hypothetical protein